uniref:Uncharacterized protein n=1 Tax=viral metagenome TaxID=1070528 RepID=A0A6M3XVE0_9ZZZZ
MGSTNVSSPAAPAAPTTTSSIADWVQNYPAVFALQQQYAPQEAQMQVDLANQYAGQYGTAMKTAQEAMYPDETKFTQDALAKAQEGMQGGVPDWQRQQYQSDLRANLGTNIGSGIGADYTSRGLLQQNQDWQKYYTDLGLSIAGKQPIATASQPQTSNYLSQFTPNSVMGYNAQNYGNYSNAYSSMYGANASLQGNVNNVNQGYVKMGLQGFGGMMMSSSRRYKTNIKLWA